MPSEQVRLGKSEAEKHKQLDREIKEMISAITHRVTDLHKSSGSGSAHNLEDDEDDGVRIITLAGNNTGATLRSEMEEKSGGKSEESEELSTYVNSNFQAINNSMMMGGSYEANDPGVRLDISELVEPRLGHREKKKKKKKGKKKEKEDGDSSSDSTTGHSD